MEKEEISTLPSLSPEQPRIDSQFTVKSACLCYGDLHNIWHGASSPIQGFPTAAPERSGTVRIHRLEYNVAALNGTWNAYRLIDFRYQEVHGWFACHSSINAEEEIDKILHVSGSPYEVDSGSNVNNEKTAAEGVLVINRYDWGVHNNRGFKEVGDGNMGEEIDFHCAGLIDLEAAKEQVLRWRDERNSERTQPKYGAWFYIPNAEYIFGRFGFDESHAAARSFLFFTGNTYFTETGFQGLSRTLRKDESPEERFSRLLQEGYPFDGLDDVPNRFSTEIPTKSDCVGPFDPSENLFEESDWDALRQFAEIRPATEIRTFFEPLKEQVLTLLNNLALTFLVRFIVPISSAESIQAISATLDPKTAKDASFERHFYPYLIETKEKIIPGFDWTVAESRINRFLTQQCRDTFKLNDGEFAGRVCRYMAYILSEALEMAGSRRQSMRTVPSSYYPPNILPSDIRWGIFDDSFLLPHFKSCRVLWYGTE